MLNLSLLKLNFYLDYVYVVISFFVSEHLMALQLIHFPADVLLAMHNF